MLTDGLLVIKGDCTDSRPPKSSLTHLKVICAQEGALLWCFVGIADADYRRGGEGEDDAKHDPVR